MGFGKVGLGVFLIATGFLGNAAAAAGDALIIGNSRYGAVQSFFGAARVVAASDTLRDAGMTVTDVSDADGAAMDEAFAAFVTDIAPQDAPILVVLAGAFLHSENGAYLLPVDNGQRPDAGSVLTKAFPIDAVLAVLAKRPGRAFLVLGETADDLEADPYLKPGLGRLDIPQGVTVIRGPAPDVAAFAIRDMARADVRVARAVERYELDAGGYLPPDLVVLRSDEISSPNSGRDFAPDPLVAEQADNAAWRLAQQADSGEGYRTYLQGFPEGLHAGAARQRLKAIAAEPFYAERRAEEALNLTREARRKVQRDLNILGHNTRGIDGIFGPGTRGALKSWQQATSRAPSGYLDPAQIVALDKGARARTAALEAEAERRAAELERQDNLLWSKVSQRKDEESLRRYLKTYPDGLHAREARAMLIRIEEQRAAVAAQKDKTAWDQARKADTIKSYRAYLDAYPKGAFTAQARSRIKDLRALQGDERGIAQARAEEKALGLNRVTIRLAEARLQQLGLDPGKVDGKINNRTREALRRFQRTRGLRVSGFLDEQTVVRLLADGIIRR